MRPDAVATRPPALRAALISILLLTPPPRAAAAGPEEATRPDCGVNALFVLLRLEGVPVTLDRLEATLPRRQPDGYSMAELAAAARSLGLSLEGVRFDRGDRPPDRPAIMFLKDGQGGHFAVLRPVGTTGTMVQVIDPLRRPGSRITTDCSRPEHGRVRSSSRVPHGRYAMPWPYSSLPPEPHSWG